MVAMEISQVFEKRNIGPVITHTNIPNIASAKAPAVPVRSDILIENLCSISFMVMDILYLTVDLWLCRLISMKVFGCFGN